MAIQRLIFSLQCGRCLVGIVVGCFLITSLVGEVMSLCCGIHEFCKSRIIDVKLRSRDVQVPCSYNSHFACALLGEWPEWDIQVL